MSKHLLWILLGFVVIESFRFFVPVDKLANEIQLLSAAPWIYASFKILHTIEKHIVHRSDKK